MSSIFEKVLKNGNKSGNLILKIFLDSRLDLKEGTIIDE